MNRIKNYNNNNNNYNNNDNNNNNINNIMSLFNEDKMLSKYTNLTYMYGPLSRAKIHIKHNYIHIYKIKMSERSKHCMRKYDK